MALSPGVQATGREQASLRREGLRGRDLRRPSSWRGAHGRARTAGDLSLIHISEPTRLALI
eukprot:6877013-Alexandrium_andersonii.AAC.1